MNQSTADTAVLSAVSNTAISSRPRIAASLFFLADGMIFGTWATLIPSFKSKFGLTEADLSIALLGMVIGAIASMPLAGQSIARRGSRANLNFLAPGFCIALALLAVAPGFVTFVAAATLFGAFKGAFDVSINSQGIAIENFVRKPIIATFQALWSIGGLIAALAVGFALKLGAGALPIALTVSLLMGLLVMFSSGSLMSGDASHSKTDGGFKLPSGRLLRIGILASMALFAEGVMMDWSAVYSSSVSGAAPWLAPIAYGVFSCCMAAGRLSGDYLIGRFGPPNILRLGGILTTAGLVVIVGIHQWPATFFGLALAGFGLANLVPILFGAGGRAHEGGVGKGVATISMMGYFGFLAGPPLIGGASHFIGLPGAFMIVILFSAFIALRGNSLLEHPSSPTDP
ncbi:MAG: MFS transporter [Verrucomicrobiota bacterium]